MCKELKDLVNTLIEYGKTLSIKDLCPAKEEGALKLLTSNPYAFCIAACIDRGTRSEIIWSIPWEIYQKYGHLDPIQFYNYSIEDWEKLIEQLKNKPRFKNDASKTLYVLTHLVVEKFEGDARKIWENKSAHEVIMTFDSIYGVGLGIANMAVLLLIKVFNCDFPDKHNINIKPDTHTIRVLYRLGLIDREDTKLAKNKTKDLNPDFPGILDSALWDIGKKFCSKQKPKCNECPVEKYCAKQGL